MENNTIIRKSADARVVQAVRRLKSTRQKDNTQEVRKNQDDIKHPTIIKPKPVIITSNYQEGNNKNSSTILNPLV